MSALTTVRPAEPHRRGEGAPGGRRRGGPSARSWSCRTGSTPIPEPAYEEHHAAAWVAEALARHGFEVQAPAGSLATAIRAVKRGGGGDGPRIGILAEYDALPGLGHGCGHNTMAASGVGAAIALAVDRRRAARARSSSSAARPRNAAVARSR